MSGRIVIATLFGIFLGGAVAGEIDGTIVVKHKLTARKVTASLSSYQRGTAVDLGSQTHDDPLAFERAHVVVYLEGDRPSNKPAAATMAQENRQFVPDLLVIPAGSTISFPNMDPIFHNVFSLSKARMFDLGNYSKDQTRTVTFSKVGVVLVNCYLHPNMAAAIVVAPNQWCAKADKDGRFVFRDVPAGRYTVVAWHKTSGFFRQEIKVDSHGQSTIEFLIPLDENGLTRVAARR